MLYSTTHNAAILAISFKSRKERQQAHVFKIKRKYQAPDKVILAN